MPLWLVVLLIGLVVVVAVSGFVLGRARQPKVEQFELCRCRRCGQKIRYLSSKAGQMGMCPRCKDRFTLPDASQVYASETQPSPARVGQVVRRHSWYRGQVLN
jgi:hypothetical protein